MTKPPLIVRIPTPAWLIGSIVIALALGWAFDLPPIVRQRPIGVALLVIGVACSAWAVRTFRSLRAEIIPASESHTSLVASGPFRFSRNPMYLGVVTIAVGAALLAGTWAMWLVPVVVFALDHFVIIPFEERSMQRAFGDAYDVYRTRVRRWLFAEGAGPRQALPTSRATLAARTRSTIATRRRSRS
jgi:protein-S-isoprenylcysteine O-methyltransferase Ste14